MSKITQSNKKKRMRRIAREIAPAVMLVLPSDVMAALVSHSQGRGLYAVSSTRDFWDKWTRAANDPRAEDNHWPKRFVRAIMHLRNGQMPRGRLVQNIYTEILSLRDKHL